MVLPEDSNNAVVDALNRIANHYDSIVPTMRKNQEAILDDNRSTLDKMYEGIFKKA